MFYLVRPLRCILIPDAASGFIKNSSGFDCQIRNISGTLIWFGPKIQVNRNIIFKAVFISGFLLLKFLFRFRTFNNIGIYRKLIDSGSWKDNPTILTICIFK